VIIDRQTTALVVDSTGDLPPSLAGDPNITVVPLTVFIDGVPYRDSVDLSPEQFFEKLVSSRDLPTTSQPSPGTFEETYRRLRERYQRVYSIHMNAGYGGSCASGAMAAAAVDGVTVIDSRLVSGGQALLVDRLVARLDRGTPQEEFEAYVDYFHAHKTFFVLLHDLIYAHKGGRLGRASYLVGNALGIKPVLHIDESTEIFRKARGWRGGLRVMRDGFLERTEPGRDTYVNISHALNLSGMADLQELLLATDRVIHLRPPSIVGSVTGVHAGPAAVGVSFIQE
jgi:DegV family protein with EDD domain